MGSTAAPSWSPARLAIALAIQVAFAVVDIAIPGSAALTITASDQVVKRLDSQMI